MVHFCCVSGCKQEWYPGCGVSFHRADHNLTYVRLPKDAVMAEEWKKIIPGKLTKTSVVCNKHFKDEDFINQSKKILKSNVVPSKFPVIVPPFLPFPSNDTVFRYYTPTKSTLMSNRARQVN